MHVSVADETGANQIRVSAPNTPLSGNTSGAVSTKTRESNIRWAIFSTGTGHVVLVPQDDDMVPQVDDQLLKVVVQECSTVPIMSETTVCSRSPSEATFELLFNEGYVSNRDIVPQATLLEFEEELVEATLHATGDETKLEEEKVDNAPEDQVVIIVHNTIKK